MSRGRTPPDPDYQARVRESFARQNFMTLLGASITAVGPGSCEITRKVNKRTRSVTWTYSGDPSVTLRFDSPL